MVAIHRDDDELCGFVERRAEGWRALAVFGGNLGVYASQDEAERRVREHGLASLAERWSLTSRADGSEQVVCVQEASPAAVTVALGYYSLPGVPSLTITKGQLDAGEYDLRLPDS